jgi:hypothetical protein
VTKAQEYLAENNPKKADEALRIAEQRSTALYFGMISPLVQARQNLWWAFRNYSTSTNAEAGTHLAQARNNLNMAAAGKSSKAKEEAGKLSTELGELEKKLAGAGKVAESELKAAWERSEALAERSAAYLSAGLSEAETTLGVENYLIEARLHVTYAETYQLTTSEPDNAIKELDIVYSYLHKAESNPLADSADRKKMHEIGNIVLSLKLMPTESDSTVQDRYETVKEEIKDLSGYETSRDEIREFRDL